MVKILRFFGIKLTHLRYGKHLIKLKLCPVQKCLWVAYSCKTYKSYTSAWKGKKYQSENRVSAVVMFLNYCVKEKLFFKWTLYIDFMQFHYAEVECLRGSGIAWSIFDRVPLTLGYLSITWQCPSCRTTVSVNKFRAKEEHLHCAAVFLFFKSIRIHSIFKSFSPGEERRLRMCVASLGR